MTCVWLREFEARAWRVCGIFARVDASAVIRWAHAVGYRVGADVDPATDGMMSWVKAPDREALLAEWEVAGAPGRSVHSPFSNA